MEDCFPDPIWLLRVSGHIFWSIQYFSHIPRICLQDFGWKVRYLCYCISEWHINLHQGCRPAIRWGCALSSRSTPEIFAFRQPEEMSFSLGWGSFLGIRSVIQGYQHGGRKNRGCQEMAWTKVSTGHPSFSRLCQFLLAIHLRLQQNSSSTHLNAKNN